MLSLLTTFFYPKTEERLKEFEYCFNINIQNKYINKITVFAELKEFTDIPYFMKHKKINVIKFNKRPMYSDFFLYARENIPFNENVIISNTDIYFDHTLDLLKYIDLKNTLICLTRRNLDSDGKFSLQGCGDSHDAWIFKNPISFNDTDIYIGISGCDSWLAKKAIDNGINVINPCLELFANHVHFCEERNSLLEDGKRYWDFPGYDSGLRIPFDFLRKG